MLLSLDFETGGISDREKAPVTLGVAIFDGPELIRSKEWLFKPIRDYKGELRFSYGAKAAEVHGYTLEDQETKGQDYREVYGELFEWLGGVWSKPVLSHGSNFDSDVWNNWQFALGSYDRKKRLFVPASEILIGPWLCSQRIARATLAVPNDVPNMKLDTLCQFFGHGPQGDIHGAEKDAILAGRLYWSLRERRKAVAA